MRAPEVTTNWRIVPHYPDYVVSDEGDVVNTSTKKWLNYYEDDRGYARVTLYNRGLPRNFYVHQLVALCFLMDYELGMPLIHRNGKNYDNRASNLRLRREEATRYHAGGSDYIEAPRVLIIETGQTFKNAYSCAEYLGTHASNIYRVLNGKALSHKGYTFKYVDMQMTLG